MMRGATEGAPLGRGRTSRGFAAMQPGGAVSSGIRAKGGGHALLVIPAEAGIPARVRTACVPARCGATLRDFSSWDPGLRRDDGRGPHDEAVKFDRKARDAAAANRAYLDAMDTHTKIDSDAAWRAVLARDKAADG